MTSAKARILLVDDEPKNLIALSSVLEGDDRELTLAHSGEEALRHLLLDDYAVILLDILMPGMDGFETAELIRERNQSRDTPIIFLTAAVRGEFSVAKGYALGGVDYIMKPFDPDMLRAKVAVFVELFKKNKELEQQAVRLAETSALLKGVLDGSTEHAIMALDRDCTFVEWNEGAARLYGYSRAEVVGKASIDLIYLDKEDAPSCSELFARADNDQTAELEAEHRRANGQIFPVWVSITLRRSARDEPIGYVVIAKDISDLRRAEESRLQLLSETAARLEAESAQRELQQIVDTLPEAILIVDEQLQLRLWNNSARDLFGNFQVEPEKLERRRRSTDLPPLPSLPASLLALAQTLRKGSSVAGERLTLRHDKEDRDVPVLATATPFVSSEGRLKGGILSIQDISALTEMEKQKDAFLAALAHDLRTPLTVILGKAQILERRALRAPGEEFAFFAELSSSIARSSKRAASLVNGLLDNARLQMDSPIDLSLEEVNLDELLSDLAQDVTLVSDRHQLHFESAQQPITGLWDRERVMRVLNNLVNNAVKYTPEGGLIEISCRIDDGSAVVEVRDSGIGIPARDQARIFDLFFRARNAAERFDGVGIGLFGAKKIVESHGGSISLQSEEGKGTTFTVRLPLAQVKEAAAAG